MENGIKRNECLFCGCSGDECGISEKRFSGLLPIATPVCVRCSDSMGPMPPLQWLRWIKQNNPQQWEQIVHNHSKSGEPISVAIRLIRLE